MVSLEPLADWPSNAAFLDAYFAGEDGVPVKIANAFCVFEKYAGDIMWRHTESEIHDEEVVIISCNFKFICMHYMLSLEMNEYKLKGKRKLDLFYLNLFLWETGSKDPSPSLLHLRDVQNSVN